MIVEAIKSSTPAPSPPSTQGMPCLPSAPRHGLALIDEQHMNDAQRFADGSAPLGSAWKIDHTAGSIRGLDARAGIGHLAQALGGHCRYKTALSARLSEFAILCTARLWRAQNEWFAHAPMAEKAGVKRRRFRICAPAGSKIRTQGRARNFCVCARTLQDQARERPHLQARTRLPRRRCYGRTHRILGYYV